MFDSFNKSEKLMNYLGRTGLGKLAGSYNQIFANQSVNTSNFTIECLGGLDRGIVVVSNTMGEILVTERINAESATRVEISTFSEATAEELCGVVLFLNLVQEIAIDDSEGRFKNWIDFCIMSAKDALKAKL